MRDLTATELRVLTLAAEGLTSLEIAFEARRPYETIRSQRKLVLLKLGARSMAHAVAIGFREELIS